MTLTSKLSEIYKQTEVTVRLSSKVSKEEKEIELFLLTELKPMYERFKKQWILCVPHHLN